MMAQQPPLVIRWAREYGWLQVVDTASGEVHEIRAEDAPPYWRAIAQEAKKAQRLAAAQS
jgi:hypothetical protein